MKKLLIILFIPLLSFGQNNNISIEVNKNYKLVTENLMDSIFSKANNEYNFISDSEQENLLLKIRQKNSRYYVEKQSEYYNFSNNILLLELNQDRILINQEYAKDIVEKATDKLEKSGFTINSYDSGLDYLNGAKYIYWEFSAKNPSIKITQSEYQFGMIIQHIFSQYYISINSSDKIDFKNFINIKIGSD